MINRNNKKGFVLVLSLVMLVGMSMTGVILLNIANDKVSKNSITEQNYQSLYAAQVGIFVGQELLTNLINKNNKHPNNIDLDTPASISFVDVTSQSTGITSDRCINSFSEPINRTIPYFHFRRNFYEWLRFNTSGDVKANINSTTKNYNFEFFARQFGGSPMIDGFSVQTDIKVYKIYACGMFDEPDGSLSVTVPIEKLIYVIK
jgi:hypothetical protein